MNIEQRRYIGDGVYVGHNGWAVVLTTENGISTTNEIVLEPEVIQALIAWWDAVKNGKDAP